jgi:UDP-N-acetylglucosamine diphosphorylase/glucosamine-1-phosphate N-acetyltransferase
MATLCIFEDEGVDRLKPLTHLRPLWDLLCGMRTLGEKILAHYPGARPVLSCRPELAALAARETGMPVNTPVGGTVLFVNGRVLLDRAVPLDGPEEYALFGGNTAYLRIDASRLPTPHHEFFLAPRLAERTEGLGIARREESIRGIDHAWDLISRLSDCIVSDFSSGGGEGMIEEGAVLLNRRDVRLGAGARLYPGSVVDAEPGPVHIGEGTVVQPGCFIQGPAYVGPSSLIRAGARIHGGVSIGETCRIGGEVEASIFHPFSNKQHDGYVGHSCIGSWCNLGAGTCTSDLKNNYGSVRMILQGERIDTGLTFLGTIMGDHTKTGINTSLGTGTIVGTMVNLFGGGVSPAVVPSFSWGGAGGFETHDLTRALVTARRAMARRGRTLGQEERDLLTRVFRDTEAERRGFIGKTPS